MMTPTSLAHPTAVPRGRWYYIAGQTLPLVGNAGSMARVGVPDL